MPKDVIIIGGGVIGLSTAWFTAQRGHRVTVIDRHPADHEGCSFGNMGMIVPSHIVPLAAPGMVSLGLKWMGNPESPFYIRPSLDPALIDWCWKFYRSANARHVECAAPVLRDLHLASRALFEELSALWENDFNLVRQGLLMLCKTQHGLDEEARAATLARRFGLPAEVLDPQQTAALDPAVRMDVAGSVYYAKDCHLTPARFMQSLRTRLETQGVKFLWNTALTGWNAPASARPSVRAVRTDAGEITADEFILCGGSWSSEMSRGLSIKLPLQPGKGYTLTLAKPPRLPNLCSILVEARVAATPMGTSLRFGGTLELSGFNSPTHPERIRGIVQAIPKYFPEFFPADFLNIEPWSGLRPCSPDGLPYCGRTRRYANLSIATGHAMMGLSLAPITGKLLAQIVSDEKPSIDLSLLHPDRFN